jgi:hypothetical protein
MKTNQLIAIAAAVVAVLFIVVIVLFSRQRGLEDEIAGLRTALETMQVARAIPAQPADDSPSSASDASRIGRPEPAAYDDLLTDARTRLLDLERIVSGQADFIEDLLAENARIAEQRRKAALRSWSPGAGHGRAGHADPRRPPKRVGARGRGWRSRVAGGGI